VWTNSLLDNKENRESSRARTKYFKKIACKAWKSFMWLAKLQISCFGSSGSQRVFCSILYIRKGPVFLFNILMLFFDSFPSAQWAKLLRRIFISLLFVCFGINLLMKRGRPYDFTVNYIKKAWKNLLISNFSRYSISTIF